MLEARAVGHELAGGTCLDPFGCGVDSAYVPIDFKSALRLLMAHRNAPGKPRTHGRGPQFASRAPVRHAKGFATLEDELCGLVRGGDYAGPGRSPDRADALVWAAWELVFGWTGEVGVRKP